MYYIGRKTTVGKNPLSVSTRPTPKLSTVAQMPDVRCGKILYLWSSPDATVHHCLYVIYSDLYHNLKWMTYYHVSDMSPCVQQCLSSTADQNFWIVDCQSKWPIGLSVRKECIWTVSQKGQLDCQSKRSVGCQSKSSTWLLVRKVIWIVSPKGHVDWQSSRPC